LSRLLLVQVLVIISKPGEVLGRIPMKVR